MSEGEMTITTLPDADWHAIIADVTAALSGFFSAQPALSSFDCPGVVRQSEELARLCRFFLDSQLWFVQLTR